MKRLILKDLLLLFISITYFQCLSAQVYNNRKIVSDTIFMNNNEMKTGKVLSIDNDAVRFLYSGESIEFIIKKETIKKIKFSSGRIEMFGDYNQDDLNFLESFKNRKGKIAILPFNFITNDNSLNNDAMTLKLQSTCYNLLKEYTSGVLIQDPITTNNILGKKVKTESLLNYTPKEMCLILGVEYVVYGVININNIGTSVSSNSWSNDHIREITKSSSKPVEVYDEYYYGRYPTSQPYGSYNFSYDGNTKKIKETVTNRIGNVQTQTQYENGDIVNNNVEINPMPYNRDFYYYGNNYSNNKSKVLEKRESTVYSGSTYNNSNSEVVTNYNTEVDFNFYNDEGVNLYSKSRSSFGGSIDSYIQTLKYLIKRCPFGKNVKK